MFMMTGIQQGVVIAHLFHFDWSKRFVALRRRLAVAFAR